MWWDLFYFVVLWSSIMLKYQVRTLGRSSEKRRQSSAVPIKDVFNVIGGNSSASNHQQQQQSANSSSAELECPGSPWQSNNHLRRRGRSTSVSSLSSTSTSSETSFEWVSTYTMYIVALHSTVVKFKLVKKFNDELLTKFFFHWLTDWYSFFIHWNFETRFFFFPFIRYIFSNRVSTRNRVRYTTN